MRKYNLFKNEVTWIFFLALIVRVIFVQVLPLPAPDTGVYDSVAINLLKHGNYSLDNVTPDPSKPPIYPFFLAGIYAIFGHSFLAVRLIQSIIDSVTCIFIYLIAVKIFNNKKTGLLASLIAAIYPSFLASCSFVLTETLTTFLLTVSIYLLTCTLISGSWLTAIVSGIMWGLATLCRPIILLWPTILLLAPLVLRLHRKIIIAFIWVCTVMVLTISPWTIRNYVVFNKIIPIGIGGGANLWLGSYQPWDGDYNYKDISDKNNLVSGLSPIEADEKFKEEAVKNIKKDPSGYMKLCIKKFGRFWFQVPGSKEVLRNRPLARAVVYTAYYPVLLFFILGLAGLVKKKNIYVMPAVLIIFYFNFLHVMLFVIPRYRIPIMPLVVIISASGLIMTVDHIKRYFRLKEDK